MCAGVLVPVLKQKHSVKYFEGIGFAFMLNWHGFLHVGQGLCPSLPFEQANPFYSVHREGCITF